MIVDILHKALSAFMGKEMPREEVEKFASVGELKLFNPNDFFISKGQLPRKIGFVLEGLFRYFYIDTEGREFTRDFWYENYFITAYSALSKGRTSPFFIEALEPSKVFEISAERWVELKKGHNCWNEVLVAILEYKFYLKERREYELLLLDAYERYLIFLEDYSEIKDRVKQHMIASYLGIAPESLSRARKKYSS